MLVQAVSDARHNGDWNRWRDLPALMATSGRAKSFYGTSATFTVDLPMVSVPRRHNHVGRDILHSSGRVSLPRPNKAQRLAVTQVIPPRPLHKV